ncbi:MAG: PD-(D/E)XK nuclease domain-containing protein, partial [Prevotella sp.]|nr:PD-(D/E)XK nuclease domain-containing protein [Prevotella sp.]
LYVFFKLLGFYVEVERPTSDGRMDMIVKTADYIFIFEFKLDKTADETLQQIEDKGYALPYAADPRRLYKIGVNFSSERRCIGEWKMVEG